MSFSAGSGEIIQNHVSYEDKVYVLNFEANVRGRLDRVYAVLTDYNKLHFLSGAVLESDILEKNDASVRLRFLTKTCILIFCFKKTLVTDVMEQAYGVFKAENVGELSDFKFGRGNWNLTSTNIHETRLQFHGQIKPKFWIPPVIGPFLIENEMESIARNAINRLEKKLHK
jgi:hypothetical protein